jgi:hypothetical protein
MDVLAALLACSLYPADDALVRALAESNSHSNPYFVYDPTLDPNDGELPSEPHSVAQALARANEVSAKGAIPLLGLFEIPPTWAAAFGRDRAEAFDACTNVAIGTAWLSNFASDCLRAAHAPHTARAARDERACVLRRYADALGMPDLVTVVTLELRAQRPVPLAIFEAPIFTPSSPRPWGPDRVFAPLDSLLLPPKPEAKP